MSRRHLSSYWPWRSKHTCGWNPARWSPAAHSRTPGSGTAPKQTKCSLSWKHGPTLKYSSAKKPQNQTIPKPKLGLFLFFKSNGFCFPCCKLNLELENQLGSSPSAINILQPEPKHYLHLHDPKVINWPQIWMSCLTMCLFIIINTRLIQSAKGFWHPVSWQELFLMFCKATLVLAILLHQK